MTEVLAALIGAVATAIIMAGSAALTVVVMRQKNQRELDLEAKLLAHSWGDYREILVSPTLASQQSSVPPTPGSGDEDPLISEDAMFEDFELAESPMLRG